MEFQTLQYSIDMLVQRVRAGRLALPDFQRDFVWSPSRVVELLDSVARQWPIGSLLLLSGPQPFAIREIDGAPKVAGDQLDLYILDGQQRITSLFHAITDSSEYCYFIDFSALSSNEEDYIRWERKDKFYKNYPSVADRATHELALISDVWDSEQFYAWLDKLNDTNKKINHVILRDKRLAGLQSKVYKVATIQLEQEINLEALARIFETLNRTGVRLSAFDLMVAALYPSGFKLRDEWDSAKSKHEILRTLNVEAIEILKLTALIVRTTLGRGESAGVRQGDLLHIKRHLIRENWHTSLDLYVKAAEFCAKRYGVICSELVPSWSMILGVAGWMRDKASNKEIDHWWTLRLLQQHYAQAANTRIVSDFENIPNIDYTETNYDPPEILGALSEPAKRNGLLNSGFAALLVKKGARDIISGKPLSDEKIIYIRTLDSDGKIKKTSGSAPISSTIILSEASDRKVGKEKHISELGLFAEEAIHSQGFDTRIFARHPSFMMEIFKPETFDEI